MTTGAEPTALSRWGLRLGPVFFLIVLSWPSALEAPAHRLAAIFALVITFWLTEAIPLAATALLGPALAVVLGVGSAREVFQPFGHPVIFLFLGSFLIAKAMSLHGLDRRLALFVLSRKWVGERPGRILLAFGVVAASLSMWISNTATAAMMLPMGMGVLRSLPLQTGSGAKENKFPVALMLMIAYSCQIGGIATPVGTPPNLIAIGMLQEIAGLEIGFLDWMIVGLPISIVCFVLASLVLLRSFRVRDIGLAGASEIVRKEREALGQWSRGEKAAAAAFGLAVAGWILPGVLSRLPIGGVGVVAALPEAAVALLAAMILFAVPMAGGEGGRVLGWKSASHLDWGTIILFGGGLSLGALAFQTGLAGVMAGSLTRLSSQVPYVVLLLAVIILADLLTEFMSNTATANLLIPVVLALGAGIPNASFQLAAAAAVGCSLAFCLPVATPPNAIVYGSGRVDLGSMVKAGIWLDALCGVAAWLGLVAFGSWG